MPIQETFSCVSIEPSQSIQWNGKNKDEIKDFIESVMACNIVVRVFDNLRIKVYIIHDCVQANLSEYFVYYPDLNVIVSVKESVFNQKYSKIVS